MTINEKAALAEKAARASGEMLEHHGAFKVRRKSENDFVTEMDYKSEALIREMLLAACPEDQFFGEESGGPSAVVRRDEPHERPFLRHRRPDRPLSPVRPGGAFRVHHLRRHPGEGGSLPRGCFCARSGR